MPLWLSRVSISGVPKAVITRARRVLRTLEEQQTDSRDSAQGQLALDVPDDDPVAETPSALDQALADIDPDSLSPREALDVLYRLKSLED